MVTASVAMLALIGSVADVGAALDATLGGGMTNVADAQAALSETLGWSVQSEKGVRLSGSRVAVRDIDIEELAGEIDDPHRVRHYFEASGYGPDPLRVSAPADGGVTVYRRVSSGVFLRQEAVQCPKDVVFGVSWPGRFLVRDADPAPAEEEKAYFNVSDPSRDPALKAAWGLFPVAPATIAGPVPLILVHGAATDRWADFMHWAERSPDAAALRAQYQLWNFRHETPGINVPVGYDPNCPAFEESVVAHLDRFMRAAMIDGVQGSTGATHYLSDGPFVMLAHSAGPMKARAFLAAFREHAERCLAIVSLGGTNMGTPIGTVEWMRHVTSRLGFFHPGLMDLTMEGAINTDYLSNRRQTEIDMGWLNHDAAGGFGLPAVPFRTWSSELGRHDRFLSPRDANRTGARTLPGIEEDTTFEPQELLDTFCGNLDLVTPTRRGAMHTDKLILYASYVLPGEDMLGLIRRADDGIMPTAKNLIENLGVRLIAWLFQFLQSAGGDWPASPYLLSDGAVPLQSQLMLDGRETERVYETTEIMGWRVPAWPLRPNEDVIAQHSLVPMDRIRILEGWSHLDTVTGRYDRTTGQSTLFTMVAADLADLLR